MKIKYINRKTGEILEEKPPAEWLLKILYKNTVGKHLLLPIIKRKFVSVLYGKKMDSPSSKKNIYPFIKQLNINISEAKKDISEFTSFNDFFYRKLKPSARKIEPGFVSPGDGRLLAFENIKDLNSFFIKGVKFTLDNFLNNINLANNYRNASMLILRLAPNDYHRFHFPCDGIPSKTKKIKGNYLSVSPYALASNFTKVFCENKREICILNTNSKGNILIIPVGATMVGSIINTYTPNKNIKKGDEMGYFAFGGSTVVILSDKDKMRIDEDLIENTKNKTETFVRMGERIGL